MPANSSSAKARCVSRQRARVAVLPFTRKQERNENVERRLPLVSMKEGWLSSGDLCFGSLSFHGCWSWSDAHVSMASSWGGLGEIGCSLGRKSGKGRSGRQTKSGASGSELLLAGKHVPDGVGESSCEVDLGDLGTALLSEPALGSLVALGVGGVP